MSSIVILNRSLHFPHIKYNRTNNQWTNLKYKQSVRIKTRSDFSSQKVVFPAGVGFRRGKGRRVWNRSFYHRRGWYCCCIKLHRSVFSPPRYNHHHHTSPFSAGDACALFSLARRRSAVYITRDLRPKADPLIAQSHGSTMISSLSRSLNARTNSWNNFGTCGTMSTTMATKIIARRLI